MNYQRQEASMKMFHCIDDVLGSVRMLLLISSKKHFLYNFFFLEIFYKINFGAILGTID